MANLIPDKITPLTEEQAACALNEAWSELFGFYPHIDSLSIIWAQSALETGRWKFIHCYNFGNIKKTKDHDYCMFRCSEILNGKEVFFNPPHPQTHFNAYSDAVAGAKEYLQFVSGRTRYKDAWRQLTLGNPVKYCAALKLAGYFTANLTSYTKGVVSLVNECKRKQLTWSSLNVPQVDENVFVSNDYANSTPTTPFKVIDLEIQANIKKVNPEDIDVSSSNRTIFEIIRYIIMFVAGLFKRRQ